MVYFFLHQIFRVMTLGTVILVGKKGSVRTSLLEESPDMKPHGNLWFGLCDDTPTVLSVGTDEVT